MGHLFLLLRIFDCRGASGEDEAPGTPAMPAILPQAS
jgi:hypothetical protein